jgi:hypothetical protein
MHEYHSTLSNQTIVHVEAPLTFATTFACTGAALSRVSTTQYLTSTTRYFPSSYEASTTRYRASTVGTTRYRASTVGTTRYRASSTRYCPLPGFSYTVPRYDAVLPFLDQYYYYPVRHSHSHCWLCIVTPVSVRLFTRMTMLPGEYYYPVLQPEPAGS